MELLTDYAKRYGGEVWVCNAHFERVRQSLRGDAHLEGYLKELFRDGAQLAGSATFGSPEDDMLFLTGLLYSTGSGRPVVVVHESPDKFSKPPGHLNVLEKLRTMGILTFSWQVVALEDAVTILNQDSEFAAYRTSLGG
jgi:hypothetical protein